ncbi:MAG: hypothetical protein ACREVV_09555 [Steroidobacteraceae bacterium]
MHQRALRTVLLIQAIEETDRAGEVIPLADRADASRAVVRESAPSSAGIALTCGSETFLVRRAERLLERLYARSPAVRQILALAGGLTWLGRLVLVVAIAAGLSLAALDGSRRINILAFPLIGLIAWNLLVYLLLLLSWIRTLRTQPTRRLWLSSVYERWIGSRIESLLRRSTRFNVPLSTGLRRFIGEWSAISQPLLLLRAKRLLHLAAALMALGLVAGLYVRGFVLRYEAGWESTFLGPQGARELLSALYGPAAALSGIGLGSLDDIRRLRWTAVGGGGEAAAWIHLIALTAMLYIVLPRLLAALGATFGLWRFSRRPPLPPSLLGYARTLIMSVSNGTVREVASVTPYAYEPSRESLAGLESLLAATFGANLSVTVREPIRYGEEEAISGRLAGEAAAGAGGAAGTRPRAAARPSGRLADWNVLVMTLAATPEVENHGALLSGLRDWLTQNASGAPLLVVIDEAPYAARMRGDGGFDKRLQERRAVWREFVAGYGLRACIVDLTLMRAGAAPEIAARDAARAALWTGSERA